MCPVCIFHFYAPTRSNTCFFLYNTMIIPLLTSWSRPVLLVWSLSNLLSGRVLSSCLVNTVMTEGTQSGQNHFEIKTSAPTVRVRHNLRCYVLTSLLFFPPVLAETIMIKCFPVDGASIPSPLQNIWNRLTEIHSQKWQETAHTVTIFFSAF